MGGRAPHDQNDASDTRFVACPGEAEGRNEAERPPALQGPPGRTNGGHGAQASPPPQPAPRHTKATDPPHGPRTAPSQVGGRPPPPPRHAAPTGRAGQGDPQTPLATVEGTPPGDALPPTPQPQAK